VEEPLGRAKAELGAGRVREALAALEPKTLAASLKSAIDDVARASGASRAEVEALLEWGPIDMALASLGESRGAAAAAWNDLPPVHGGLLAGVAEVTTHADNDDVGFYLDRLGQKMARDRSLAGPIDALAADVEAWQSLVRRACETVDEHPKLLASRKRRVLLRAALVLVAAAIIVPVGIASFVSWRAQKLARERVEAALDGPDPCAAEQIAPADLDVAGAAAKARAAERDRACGEMRTRAARVARCEGFASAVERGVDLEGETADQAGSLRPLIRRMKAKALDPEDLRKAPVWPCEEVDAPKRLWKVFIEAAGASTLVWRDPPPVSAEIVRRLAVTGLPSAARGTLLSRAEEISGHGVRQGDEESLVRGAELCALCKQLGIETGPNCRGLDVVLAKPPAGR